MSVDLREKDLDVMRAIFLRFPSIQSVRVFGSRARGNARRASDIDLAVFAPEMTDRAWSDFREALEDAPLAYNLDVVRLDTLADEKLRSRIATEGKEVFAKNTENKGLDNFGVNLI